LKAGFHSNLSHLTQTTLQTPKEMTLEQVDRLLPLKQRLEFLSFSSLLTLEPLSNFEQQEIGQIRNDYWDYLQPGRVVEGQIQFLS
jgi:hypothetical protein